MQFLLPLLLGVGGDWGVKALLARLAPQMAKGLLGEGMGLAGFLGGNALGEAIVHKGTLEQAANRGDTIALPKQLPDNERAFAALLEQQDDDGTL